MILGKNLLIINVWTQVGPTSNYRDLISIIFIDVYKQKNGKNSSFTRQDTFWIQHLILRWCGPLWGGPSQVCSSPLTIFDTCSEVICIIWIQSSSLLIPQVLYSTQVSKYRELQACTRTVQERLIKFTDLFDKTGKRLTLWNWATCFLTFSSAIPKNFFLCSFTKQI